MVFLHDVDRKSVLDRHYSYSYQVRFICLIALAESVCDRVLADWFACGSICVVYNLAGRQNKMNFLSSIGRSHAITSAVLVAAAISSSACTFSSCEGANQRKVMKDPRECANPVCSDSLRAFQLANDSLKSASAKKTREEPSLVVSVSDSCPLTKRELGEKTWSVLHTIAAYYPDSPTKEQQEAVVNFFRALSLLYPCPYCAEDFAESIKTSPPRYTT